MHKHKEDSAVLDRPTAEEKAEAHRQEVHEKELKKQEAEREKLPSTAIYRYATDLLEQSSGRPRPVLENEVKLATSNEVQVALLRGILAHIDGTIPKPEKD